MSELKYSIHPSEITLLRKVGGGNFGEVWEADYIGTRVAVKRLLAVDEEDLEIYIERELSTLRGVFHPHIVQLMGIVRHGKDVFIITEYVAGGSLRSILKDESIPLSWARRLSFATDIALAMAYLHHRNILHRDLKSANLLVDEAWRVKVCDFGLARKMPPAHERKHLSVVGTDEWMAPEMLLEEEYDKSADVFSFGMVLWELVTRKRPPERLAESEFAFDFEKFRKKVPKDTPKALWELLCDCSAYEPSKRPSFKAVLERLSRIFLELQNAAVCVDEQPSEVERREAEEKERKKRKEHMKIIKQVEEGGGDIKASPRAHQQQQQPQQTHQHQLAHTEQPQPQPQPQPVDDVANNQPDQVAESQTTTKDDKKGSREKDDKVEKKENKDDKNEKRKSGENRDDKKVEDNKSASQERKLEKVVSGGDKREKEKERKKSLTKEAAENILNAIKGTSPEKDLRKELKKANSKEKELNKLKRQASKDGNLHGDVSSPRTNKKKEKEKEKEKEEDKGKSKETVSSPKAARKTDERRATLTKSSAKEKPVSEKKKKTHHQEITEEEEVETRSFIKNGQEKIKIKKTIKFPFTRSQSIFLTCGVPKRKTWGAEDPVEITVKVENNSSKTIKQIQVFLQRIDQGKAPKEKDVKAKALREKTEKSFESTAAGLPLEAWQVLKTTLDYSLPSKDVLRAFAEDDPAAPGLSGSGEAVAITENAEEKDTTTDVYELVVKVSLSRGDDVPKLFTRIGMSPLFAYVPLSIVY